MKPNQLHSHVTVSDEKLTVDLADGRSLSIPLAWYPRLMHASPRERQNWQILGDGYAQRFWILLCKEAMGKVDKTIAKQVRTVK